ncbi:MAG: mannose-1-phosphate guanylyltransferase [candidate division Zixibacteria bacterium]|nr:mannose-1-phosphate guanylyltransferase [candidate division Zixibacteria bacterium]
MNYSVIIAGGKGERFWPLSRLDRPKQFLQLTSNKTMLEETIDRVKPLIPLKNIRIVAGDTMSPIILDSIDGITEKNLITEPFGRNTCLAIGLAAIHLNKEDPHAVMVVLSADHLVNPQEKLLKIFEDGAAIASKEDCLITIGIVPNRPETAYGYIKMGEMFKNENDSVVYRVSAFTEKPKLVVAQEYYYSRKYLWNSGMFIWSARAIIDAIEIYQPEMGKLLKDYAATIGTDKEMKARKELYKKANGISIDYAVLESAKNVLTIKANIVWDDVGSWTALERYKDKDSENNVLIGETAVLGTYETTIYNDSEGIVCCLGVADLVVVRSANITLVAHKTKVGDIKELLTKLGEDEKTGKYL